MPVGAAEGCDLLIFHLGLKRPWKDRSLVALVSSYGKSAGASDQAATGGGRVATRRIEAVSSSSWKCGRRNTVAL